MPSLTSLTAVPHIERVPQALPVHCTLCAVHLYVCCAQRCAQVTKATNTHTVCSALPFQCYHLGSLSTLHVQCLNSSPIYIVFS